MVIFRRIVNVYYAITIFLFSLALLILLIDGCYSTPGGFYHNPSFLEHASAVTVFLALVSLLTAIIVSTISLIKRTEIAFRPHLSIVLAILGIILYLFVTFAGPSITSSAEKIRWERCEKTGNYTSCIEPI